MALTIVPAAGHVTTPAFGNDEFAALSCARVVGIVPIVVVVVVVAFVVLFKVASSVERFFKLSTAATFCAINC